MKVIGRTDKDILYIAVEGRVDATNAQQLEEEIARLKAENAKKHTVIDAEELEYISSAGLRVILRLRKDEPTLAIINVSAEVYDIFDMTGFTDMVTVEKAFRKLSVEGCEFLAKGANGAVYRYDDETIVKVYFAKDSLPEIRQERENARKAFVLGINTAIPYGIVRIGEAYGTVTELLNATSISKLIADSPNELEKPCKYYVDLLKSIHATTVDKDSVPDMKETALSWVEDVRGALEEDKQEKLKALVEAVPEENTLLHGDYHSGNVMVQNGEPLLIDMDTLCKGNPIFELASMYNAFVGFSESDNTVCKSFFGFDFTVGREFWRMALGAYLETEDPETLESVERKAKVIGYLRMLRRALRRPEEKESLQRIAYCKAKLSELLESVEEIAL